MEFSLPETVLRIIRRFSEAGFRADVVGGCVRDMIMGIPPHDYDLTTNAFPEEMSEIFAGERMIGTGLKHGTVTLLADGEPYEITTYRVDGSYEDNRHPSSVTFTRSLEEDLARRDFTVNAMAYHPVYGLTDLFGGREDADRKIIRAVGDAETRFREDALRILRALRFSSRLGFASEEKTAEAIHRCRSLLGNVSAERIDSEWKGILGGNGYLDILRRFPDVIGAILPEFDGFLPEILTRIGEREIPPEDRMIALTSFLPDPTGAWLSATERLRADTLRKRDGIAVLTEMSRSDGGSDGDLLRMVNRVGVKNALRALKLREILTDAGSERSARLEVLLAEGKCARITDLSVKGDDLKALGFRGKEIGEKLAYLLDAVMDGKIPNDRESLLRFLTE